MVTFLFYDTKYKMDCETVLMRSVSMWISLSTHARTFFAFSIEIPAVVFVPRNFTNWTNFAIFNAISPVTVVLLVNKIKTPYFTTSVIVSSRLLIKISNFIFTLNYASTVIAAVCSLSNFCGSGRENVVRQRCRA